MSRLRSRLPALGFLWFSFCLLHVVCRSVNFQLKSPLCALTLVASIVYILSSPSRADLTANLLLALSSVYVTAGALDLAARPWNVDRFYYRPEERYANHWPRHEKINRYTPLTRYQGEVYGDLAATAQRPDLREPRQERFLTDQFGFRNEAPRPASPVSVVLLGDSVADGCGVTQQDTVTGRLRTALGPGVYNLSFISIGPWGEYVNLVSEWPRLPVAPRPRLYWILFSGNDMEDPCWPASPGRIRWNTPWQQVRARIQNIRRHSVISYLLLQWDSQAKVAKESIAVKEIFGKPLMFFAPYIRESERTVQGFKTHPYRSDMEKSIQAMGDWAREQNVEVIVLSVPTKEEVYNWVLKGKVPWSTPAAPTPFFIAIQDLCRKAGLRAYDLNSALVKESRRLYEKSGDLLWWRDDTHPNGNGHRVMADFILAQLEMQ